MTQARALRGVIGVAGALAIIELVSRAGLIDETALPPAIVVFASTTNVKISLVVYAATWPILINTLYALRDVDPLAKDTLRSFGFGRISVLWRGGAAPPPPLVTTPMR